MHLLVYNNLVQLNLCWYCNETRNVVQVTKLKYCYNVYWPYKVLYVVIVKY